MRIETGPTQFGDDWPCLTIRGDECMGFALALQLYMERHPPDPEHAIEEAPVKGLLSLLFSPDVGGKPKVQLMKDIKQCLMEKSRGV